MFRELWKFSRPVQIDEMEVKTKASHQIKLSGAKMWKKIMSALEIENCQDQRRRIG